MSENEARKLIEELSEQGKENLYRFLLMLTGEDGRQESERRAQQ